MDTFIKPRGKDDLIRMYLEKVKSGHDLFDEKKSRVQKDLPRKTVVVPPLPQLPLSPFKSSE